MENIFLIILPLVLTVATGMALAKSGILSARDWQGIEKLSFNILIPALIINAIYRSDLSLETSGPYVGAMLAAIATVGVATLLLRLPLNRAALKNTELSSMFQVTTRWNAFIVLPLADQLFGAIGLTTVAIAMAFLIPLINIVNIMVVSGLHASRFNPLVILKTIATNPLIIACAIGLALNYSQTTPPKPVLDTLHMISRGALAIGLLCIGAGFNWRRLLRPSWQVLWGVLVKNVAAPMLAFGVANWLGLGATETICAMLVVSAPAATNGYIVARQMGGNAELYAYTLSWQLVASIFTIPAMLYFSAAL